MPVKKLKRNYTLVLILAIFSVFMCWLLWHLESDMIQLGSTVDFNEGWSMETDEEQNTVVLSRRISEDMLGKVVYFYVYDAFVDAEAGGNAIYHFGQSFRYLKSPGTLWHMITVPANALDENLSIHIQYAYKNKYITSYDLRMGNSGAVVLSLLKKEALDLAVNLILLVLGVILCTIFFLQLKNKTRIVGSLYLGLLSICFVFWSNNGHFFTQLIFPYGAGQYFAYYFFLGMLPLLLLCYLETITDGLRFNYLFWSHVTLGLVLTLLQLSGIAEFTESLTIFLVFSAVEMIIAIVKLWLNRRSQPNRRLAVAFVVMVAFIIINAIMYLFNTSTGVSTTLAKMGISLYLMVSIYDSLSSIITDLTEAKQSRILRRIAFTDTLTGVGNRYAFTSEVCSLTLTELSLFSLDINNLKYYNDTFGHACGDTLICEATKLLSRVFDRLYRTGGDEFIAIGIKRTPQELIDMKNKLDGLMRDYNQDGTDVLVEIACGYSSCQAGDVSYEDILKRADAEMYKDKTALKKNSRIKSVR